MMLNAYITIVPNLSLQNFDCQRSFTYELSKAIIIRIEATPYWVKALFMYLLLPFIRIRYSWYTTKHKKVYILEYFWAVIKLFQNKFFIYNRDSWPITFYVYWSWNISIVSIQVIVEMDRQSAINFIFIFKHYGLLKGKEY